MPNINSAMVLAAGFGKRMSQDSERLPKPLVEVGGITLLQRTLAMLAKNDVTNVVINTHFKPEKMAEHISQCQKLFPNLDIHISHEEEILETGGGIRKALPILGDQPFYTINSDTICIDYGTSGLERLASSYQESEMDALLLLQSTAKAQGYDGNGDFALTGHQLSKPEQPSLPYVYTGIQILHPRLFADAPQEPFSISLFYKNALQQDHSLHRICGIEHQGDWLHVGTREALAEAETFMKTSA